MRFSTGQSARGIAASAIMMLACEATAAEIELLPATSGYPNFRHLKISGPITFGDTETLRTIVHNLRSQSHNEIPIVISYVTLNSPGGDLAESARLAEELKKSTAGIVSVRKNHICASACFLIFASADTKFAETGSRVGIHGAADAGGRESAAAKAATVNMARLASLFGVPDAIIGRMVLTPPDKMVWLSDADLRSMDATIHGE